MIMSNVHQWEDVFRQVVGVGIRTDVKSYVSSSGSEANGMVKACTATGIY